MSFLAGASLRRLTLLLLLSLSQGVALLCLWYEVKYKFSRKAELMGASVCAEGGCEVGDHFRCTRVLHLPICSCPSMQTV